MEDRLSAHECKALKMLGDHPTEFLVWGHFVGIGRPTLASLVERGLAETGQSLRYFPEIGWRITEDRWRCMYGETLAEIFTKPAGVKAYPFIVWKWPTDPNGARRPI